MARHTKTPQDTTVRVETVGVDELADAVAARINNPLKKVDEKVNRNYRSARAEQGRMLARIKRLEAENRHLQNDVDTLFKMASGQATGVTVTRHRERSSR
jgi:transcription elongation GreA/GreB family factor